MKERVNVVELTTGKDTRVFEINHAERILRMPQNGGWKLPEDSPFKFDKNNGIKRNRSESDIEVAKAKTGNSKSDKAGK